MEKIQEISPESTAVYCRACSMSAGSFFYYLKYIYLEIINTWFYPVN